VLPKKKSSKLKTTFKDSSEDESSEEVQMKYEINEHEFEEIYDDGQRED